MKTLSLRFPTAGIVVVGVLLLLAAGGASAAAPPRATQSSEYVVPLAYLTPIPIVRLAGRTTGVGARVTMLQVKSPRGSSVTVRCRGGRRKGCSFGRRTKLSPRSGVVRFREIEHRLRAGVQLAIFVSKGSRIGKYTRFSIRKAKLPVRLDSCLFPGDPFVPRDCP